MIRLPLTTLSPTQNPARMNDNSPRPARNKRRPGYDAGPCPSPSPIGWDHVPGTGLTTWGTRLVAGLGSHWAGARACFPARRLLTAEQELSNANAASELAKLLECACLFWRFSFDHILTHSPAHICHL